MPPGVADQGDAQRTDQVEHVLPEAAAVGGRMAGTVEPVVDGAAQMLNEGAVESGRDGTHLKGRVQSKGCS